MAINQSVGGDIRIKKENGHVISVCITPRKRDAGILIGVTPYFKMKPVITFGSVRCLPSGGTIQFHRWLEVEK